MRSPKHLSNANNVAVFGGQARLKRGGMKGVGRKRVMRLKMGPGRDSEKTEKRRAGAAAMAIKR